MKTKSLRRTGSHGRDVLCVLCFVLAAALVSAAAVAQDEPVGVPAWRPGAAFIVSLKCLNGTQVEVHEDMNGNNQFFIAPIAIPDMTTFKANLDAISSETPTAELDVRFPVYLSCEQMKIEAAEEINAKANRRNVTPAHILMAPVRSLEIVATVNGEPQVILNSAPSRPSASHTIPQKVVCVIRGTRAELEKWAAHRHLVCYGYVRAYKTTRNDFRVKLEEFMKSDEARELFGDENLTNKVEFRSDNGARGLTVNLGPLKAGDHKGSNISVLEQHGKRFVSRNLMQNAMASFKTQLKTSVWLEDAVDADRMLDQLARVMLAAMEGEERKFALKLVDRRLEITDSVTESVIDAGDIDDIAAKYGDVFKMLFDEKREASKTGQKATKHQKDGLDNSINVDLKQGGSIRIPAYVNLVAADRSLFANSFEATFKIIRPTRASFTIRTKIDSDVVATKALVNPEPPDTPPVKLAQRVPIFMGGEHAQLLSQDWDLHTDDWTWVRVGQRYSITRDRRSINCWVLLEAKECEKNQKYKGKTLIRAEKTIPVYTVPESDQRVIVELLAEQSEGSAEHFLRGEIHGWHAFNGGIVGGLNDVQIHIDEPGGDCHHELKGTAVFTVVVDDE